MTGPAVCVGLDVSQATLDLALRPTGERWTLANDEAAIQSLVQELRPHAPTHRAGGHRRQVRDFARATGQLAKTDAIDAQVLALFAERVRPEPRPLPDEAAQALDALLTRRRQLLMVRSNTHGQQAPAVI